MDNHRIFIANLAQGRLGRDKANLLGWPRWRLRDQLGVSLPGTGKAKVGSVGLTRRQRGGELWSAGLVNALEEFLGQREDDVRRAVQVG